MRGESLTRLEEWQGERRLKSRRWRKGRSCQALCPALRTLASTLRRRAIGGFWAEADMIVGRFLKETLLRICNGVQGWKKGAHWDKYCSNPCSLLPESRSTLTPPQPRFRYHSWPCPPLTHSTPAWTCQACSVLLGSSHRLVPLLHASSPDKDIGSTPLIPFMSLLKCHLLHATGPLYLNPEFWILYILFFFFFFAKCLSSSNIQYNLLVYYLFFTCSYWNVSSTRTNIFIIIHRCFLGAENSASL